MVYYIWILILEGFIMSQAFTLFVNLVVFSDGIQTNNPSLKDFDYSRRLTDIPTSKARSQQHAVSVNETENVLSLQRSLTSGASWTITSDIGVAARWTWSVVDPILRTERVSSALTNLSTVNVARQGYSKVVRLTFSDIPGVGIITGDEIYIGSNSGLTELNQGIFTVVAASGNWIEVLGENMVNETGVAIVDPTDIYAYSSGPVRQGDYVKISDTNFNYGNRNEFEITKVTSRFFEVQNSNTVPEGPISADVVVYDQLYKLTYIETDQPVNIYINNSSTPVQVEPIQEGQGGLVGIFLWRGPVYSIAIENKGYNSANVTSLFAT